MRLALAPLLLLLAAPAVAQGRDLCPERPGLDTPPCVLDAGRVQIEAAAAGWTRETSAGSRSDTLVAGEFLLRYGLDDRTEARLDWAPYGHVRTRDRLTGAVERQDGTGDVTLSIKRSLVAPGGGGASVALLPHVSLPTGGRAIGAGDWGAGLLLPMSFALSEGAALILTPELDAAVDEDRDGRHLAWGSAGGLQVDLGDALSAAVEMQAIRDRDPDGHATRLLGSASLAWAAGEDSQFDVGTNLGLNRATPDVELYVGVARRF